MFSQSLLPTTENDVVIWYGDYAIISKQRPFWNTTDWISGFSKTTRIDRKTDRLTLNDLEI